MKGDKVIPPVVIQSGGRQSSIDYVCGSCAKILVPGVPLKSLLIHFADIPGRVLVLCPCGTHNSCGAPSQSNDPDVKRMIQIMKDEKPED